MCKYVVKALQRKEREFRYEHVYRYKGSATKTKKMKEEIEWEIDQGSVSRNPKEKLISQNRTRSQNLFHRLK